jgi:hypothetical protein
LSCFLGINALQKIQNQQSVVRTDFTLKYYVLDELLEKNSLLKIVGTQTQVFVRSWIDYSLVRKDIIIPWLSGDLSVLCKTISHVLKDSIADIASLVTFIKEKELEGKIIFAVNFAEIDSNDLSALVDVLCLKDQNKNATVPTNKNKDQIEKSSSLASVQNPRLANIVLWHTDNQTSSTEEGILAAFSATLDLGTEKKQHSGIQLKPQKVVPIAVSVCVGIAVLGWMFLSQDTKEAEHSAAQKALTEKNDDKIEESTKKLSVEGAPTGLSEQSDSNVIKRAKERLEGELESKSSSISKNVGANDLKEMQDSSSVTSDLPKNIDQNTQTAIAATTEIELGKSSGEIVNSDKNELAKTSNSVLIAAKVDSAEKKMVVKGKALKAEKRSKTETVAILGASNAKVVNIGSSINTSSSVSNANVGVVDSNELSSVISAVENNIDSLISAWQDKDFTAYSSFYSTDFKGVKSSHKAWLKWRKKRVEKPKWVKLSRSNIKHLAPTTRYHAVTFTLNYASPNYKDKTFKKLTFEKIGQQFKIVKEENLNVVRIK